MSFANLFVIPHRPSCVQVFEHHRVLKREWYAQVRIFEKIRYILFEELSHAMRDKSFGRQLLYIRRPKDDRP